MDGQVKEQELEGAAFVREHRSLLRRYTDAVEKVRDAETQTALVVRRLRKADSRCTTLEAKLERVEEVNKKLAQDLQKLTDANADLERRLSTAHDTNAMLVGRAEEAHRLHAEAMRLIKEEVLGRATENAARQALGAAAARSPMLTPEHGRYAAAFVASAARVAASMTTGEYQTHITEVAEAAARVAGQPAEKIWDAWAAETGRVARKFTGAPAPEHPGTPVDGTYEATAKAHPRTERAVLVPLGGGLLRVQVVGESDGSSPASGFGVVRDGQLCAAQLDVDGLLALLPRHGAGSSLARDLIVRLGSLDTDVVVRGSSVEVGQQLGITATKSTIQAAIEHVSAISAGVRFDPIRSSWEIERARLEGLNVDGDALEIEIVR